MRTKKQGIYAIVNRLNGRRYVGSSSDIDHRWQQHILSLNKGRHHSRYFQRAWVKHGASAFAFEILELVLLREVLRDREQWHLDHGDCSYNRAKDAYGGVDEHTTETKRRLAEMSRKRWADPEYRAKHPAVSPSEETRAKIRAARKLQEPYWRGRKRDPETAEKLRTARLGKPNPHGTPPQEVTCIICAKTFIASAARVRKGTAKFCSRHCMGLYSAERMRAISAARIGKRGGKWRRVSVSCAECGKGEIEIQRYRVKPGRLHYCSHRCMGLAHARKRWGKGESLCECA